MWVRARAAFSTSPSFEDDNILISFAALFESMCRSVTDTRYKHNPLFVTDKCYKSPMHT